ncbi:putative disease resistance protein RGA4 [Gossypium arboreum]|uniref:putative disease resistance protein RGA4 n=1 Tax=Gossypium arboreum TaxID=29729 RepID=UPI0008196A2D|nr:putative disease resistance protein RGA4 [Gossypium arboreum]
MTRDGSSDDDFSIIPIVGMDGVGKTTFTHLIYNDGACKGFDPKVWVDQSYDDVDVANETLLNMRKWYFKEYQLNAQLTLRKEFSQKRFFLVLENAQSNNIVDNWKGLKFAFMFGAPGNKVIVITRD